MKKAKRAKSEKAGKAGGVPKNYEEYAASVPEHARGMLDKMRAAIRSAVPKDATEIISYRMPGFKRDKVLVWFAAFSEHCSLFPTAAGLEPFKDELKGFATSKGTIQFPLNKPLPTALIKKIVKARVEQAKGKGK